MQATAFFAIAVVVGFFMLVVFGAAWFIAIPIAILLFLVPAAFAAALASRKLERSHPAGGAAVPSSGEASYDPVVDPDERPATR